MMITQDGVSQELEVTVHTVNIVTGAVASRLFLPGFVSAPSGEHLRGWDYFSNKIWIAVAFDLFTRNLVASFPPDMSSQTIEADQTFFGNRNSVVFYEADAIISQSGTTDKWTRMPYSGGKTENYVTGAIVGNRLGQHPYSIGLGSDGLYWTMGRASSGSSERDIKAFTTVDIVDVGANGFTDVGLEDDRAFYQSWNGNVNAGYDFNRDRTAIRGFPIWTQAGPGFGGGDGTPGLMVLPLTATSWDAATFLQLDIATFRPDMVVADVREP